MIGKRLKHYEIEELLGTGGMGVVYRARDVRLDRPVALKVLKPQVTTDPDRRRRFLQEARSASAVTHPAIAQIYDVGEEDETIFIAMELVEGRTVRQLTASRELDLLGAVEISIQVGLGLGRAHDVGIVHRDIKSDNIMVTRDGHAKILDFGLAKLLDPQPEDGEGRDGSRDSTIETVAATRVGVVLGTVAYMSPEQARGRKVDRTSDIFSLGIVIYEMVTGELPFKGDSMLDTMHAISFDEFAPVTTIRKNMPPELHRILSRCLRKKASDRYQDTQDLVSDLKGLRRDIESGVQRAIPIEDRVRESFDWLKNSMPFGVAGLVVAAAALSLAGYLIFSDADLASVLVLGAIGLLIYRVVRNRRNRLLKRFTSKVRKLPDVRAIRVRGNQVTVVTDRAQATLYLRVNGLVETINSKQFYGEPVEATVRDDLPQEEFHQMLREPGIVYVRDDEFLDTTPDSARRSG